MAVPESLTSDYERAWAAARGQRWRTARRRCMRGLESAPNDPLLLSLLWRAEALTYRIDLNDAIERIDGIIAAHPDLLRPRIQAAAVVHVTEHRDGRLGPHQGSIARLRDALDHFPNEHVVEEMLAGVLSCAGEFEASWALYKKILTTSSSRHRGLWAHVYLVARKAGDPASADELIRRKAGWWDRVAIRLRRSDKPLLVAATAAVGVTAVVHTLFLPVIATIISLLLAFEPARRLSLFRAALSVAWIAGWAWALYFHLLFSAAPDKTLSDSWPLVVGPALAILLALTAHKMFPGERTSRPRKTYVTVITIGVLYVGDLFLPWNRACVGVFQLGVCVSRSGWSAGGSIAGLAVGILLAIQLLALVGIELSPSVLRRNRGAIGLSSILLLLTILRIVAIPDDLWFGAFIGMALAGALFAISVGAARRAAPGALSQSPGTAPSS